MLRSTQSRVIALLAAVVLVFVAALFTLRRVQTGQVEMLFDARSREVAGVLDRVLLMNQQGLKGHAADYSRWDDMVRFALTRDTSWAEANVRPSLDVFGYDVAWVLDARMRPIYSVGRGASAPAEHLPLDHHRYGPLLRGDPFRHTFERVDGDALELWTAPIQPTSDAERRTPPSGYLIIGRYWDSRVLAELSRLVGGEATLLEPGQASRAPRSDARKGILEIDRPFVDFEGDSVTTLRLTVRHTVFAEIDRAARHTSLAVVALALASALAVLVAIVAWVVLPLRRVRDAMRHEDPARLGSMVRREDEFGRLAMLIVQFFVQRDTLVDEVRERRRAELEAELQKDFVRQVLDTDPDPIYVVDGRGSIVLANEGAHLAFGAAPGTLPGRCAAEVLEPFGLSDSFQRGHALAIESWMPQTADERLTSVDGRPRRFESVRFPLQRPDGEALVLTLSADVTERMRERHELLAAKEAAEAAVHARSQFLANISHELRTPMHGILSYARFGLREWGTAERDELREFFENIHESGESLLALLNDLLDLAKLESGRMVFEFGPVDPAEVVDSVLVEFEPLAHERGLTLTATTVATCTGAAPEMHADRTKLLQVLRNLVSNAAKFSPEDGDIEVVTEWTPQLVRLSVRDQGTGVPEEDVERIFDKFVQSGMGKSTSGGTGLGLAICREIMDVHGGRIWAENRPEGGACFRIELPRADVMAYPGLGAAGEAPTDDRAA